MKRVLIILGLLSISLLNYSVLANENIKAANTTNTSSGDLDVKITVNPHNTNPLCAQLDFTSAKKVSVAIKIIGQDGTASDIDKHFKELKKEHSIPILGLYPDYANQVQITTYNKSGKKIDSKILTIKTDVLKEVYNKEIEIIKNDITALDNRLYLDITSRVAFDKFGKIRWIYDTEREKIQIFRKTLDGKNLLCLQGHKRPASVIILSLMGEIIEEYPYDYIGRHDVRELPSGNFLVAAGDSAPGAEDIVLEIDKTSREIIKKWDYREILDTSRAHIYGDRRKSDWLHINCVFYDDTDNSIIISGRHQNAVVKIDAATSEIKWILGPHYGWKPEFKKYLLKPINFKQDEFNWGQHAPLVMPNGNVFLFNNGNYRDARKKYQGKAHSTVVEYKINTDDMTVEIVWQYGKDRDLYTGARGDVDFMEDSGNRLVSFMAKSPTKSTPLIIELNDKDEVIFEAVFDRDNKRYRAEKIDLYK